ncbi:MAG: chorismate synthase [Eubacteriaceae bacterium]|nr:chorismate synthase [Eubacteriaceae bacterium]
MDNASYRFGEKLTLEITGESHGPFVRAVLSGLPAGFCPDQEELRSFMLRRASSGKTGATERHEDDVPEFTAGLRDGCTDGSPLVIRIANADVRTQDYDTLSRVPRPGHADLAAYRKYGFIPSGGGAFSGRMTAPLCAAGGIVIQLLRERGIGIFSHLFSVGEVFDIPYDPMAPTAENCPDFPAVSPRYAKLMKMEIESAMRAGDSVGGVIECAVRGLPAGLGGPLYEGVEGAIASAVFAVPAVKGIEFGSGFSSARMRGSANNDGYRIRDDEVAFESNCSGGILGGITTGMPLIFRTAVKPTPSIALPQHSVDLKRMEDTVLEVKGRHDTCIALRALPAIEASCALALYDMILKEET